MARSKVLPFVTPSKKKTAEKPSLFKDDLFMETISGLRFHITKYHTVHIHSNAGCLFKKDISIFEQELDDLKLEELDIGQSHIIKGSGDNDHLVFTRTDDDIQISLKKRGFETIEKVKNLLHKKSKKGGSK